jgi:hypothetical protein
MFHHFPAELQIQDYLVTSTSLQYEESPTLTYLTSATHIGYLLNDGQDGYISKAFPSLEYEYSRFPSDDELSRVQVQDLDCESIRNMSSAPNYQWIDLDGEGLAGILSEQATGWFYKRNLSANNQAVFPGVERQSGPVAKLGPIEIVGQKPITHTNDRPSFADVRGDGRTNLVLMDGPAWGFYSRDFESAQGVGWTPFREFKSYPNVNTKDPDLRFIDLTGDGLPDILLSKDSAFVWHPSLGAEGYGSGLRVPQSLDEERGPKLVFADAGSAYTWQICRGMV